MENNVGYIERVIKQIASDKRKVVSLILSVLSVITTIVYICSVAVSGIHLFFVFTMLIAAFVNALYVVDVESKIKYADDMFVCGIGLLLIGLILKVIKIGIGFSIVYFIGYLFYAMAFLLLGGYCLKSQGKSVFIKILLILCGAWSIFEFFNLNVNITWKLFRISEAFLSISYFCLFYAIEKAETPFSEKVGNYKNQIPSMKINIIILLIIAIISGGIGCVLKLDKKKNTVVKKNNTVTVQENKPVTTATPAPKKSTVTSTVVPAEEKPAEVEEIKIGDSVETEAFTFKLNKVELSHRVEPERPPSYYTYYQAEADHTYIYVNASITNKEKYSLECDEIYSVTADFDGGYEYKGFNIADDTDGDFTYANITSVNPLETLGVHCLIDCPSAVEEEGKPLFITIIMKNGSKYKYIIK